MATPRRAAAGCEIADVDRRGAGHRPRPVHEPRVVLDALVGGEHGQLVDRGRVRGGVGVRRRPEDADDAAAGRPEHALELRHDRRVRVREPVGQDLRPDDDRAVGRGRLAELAVEAGERHRVGVERARRRAATGRTSGAPTRRGRPASPRGCDAARPGRGRSTWAGRSSWAGRPLARGAGAPPTASPDNNPARPERFRCRRYTALPPLEEPVMTVAAVILAASPGIRPRGRRRHARRAAPHGRGVGRRRDADRRVLVRSRRAPSRRPSRTPRSRSSTRSIPRAGRSRQIVNGVRAAASLVAETDAALVWPARMTWVDAETVTTLIHAYGEDRASVTRPTSDGEPGLPILLPVRAPRRVRRARRRPDAGRPVRRPRGGGRPVPRHRDRRPGRHPRRRDRAGRPAALRRAARARRRARARVGLGRGRRAGRRAGHRPRPAHDRPAPDPAWAVRDAARSASRSSSSSPSWRSRPSRGTPSRSRCSPRPTASLASTREVTFTDAGDGLEWAPAGGAPTTGLVVYPGGKVPAEAYGPLAQAIAAEGYLVA